MPPDPPKLGETLGVLHCLQFLVGDHRTGEHLVLGLWLDQPKNIGIDQPAHQAWSQLHLNVLDMNDQRTSRPRKFYFYGIHNFAGAENFAPTNDQASLTGATCALHLLGSD